MKQILLVEGTDDQHVVWALLLREGFPEVFKVDQKGGIDKLLEVIPVQLKGSGMVAVGAVIDADVSLSDRWRSLTSILSKSGYLNVPDSPDPNGTVLNQAGMPRFGAWLMPDNTLSGMLEDFVAKLVPIGDNGFAHAQGVLADLPEEVQRFKPIHSAKAQIHTWLSWQEDPGTPMGLAITKKYLDAAAPEATRFVKWLRKLFL